MKKRIGFTRPADQLFVGAHESYRFSIGDEIRVPLFSRWQRFKWWILSLLRRRHKLVVTAVDHSRGIITLGDGR